VLHLIEEPAHHAGDAASTRGLLALAVEVIVDGLPYDDQANRPTGMMRTCSTSQGR
jgi:hypothetical protein